MYWLVRNGETNRLYLVSQAKSRMSIEMFIQLTYQSKSQTFSWVTKTYSMSAYHCMKS